jgi:LysR family tcuABC transcriptional regulator
MELRQLRYFVAAVEAGGMGRAAERLGVVTSALSQQVSRLESELATRLLVRSSTGVAPTEAGLAFLRQAQLALRHADAAASAARHARLSGQVSIGLPSTIASVLGVPMIEAMKARHPAVRLHVVESLSGHLAAMLGARLIDLAVLFETTAARRLSMTPLLDERLYVVGRPGSRGMPAGERVRLAALRDTPLILPSASHGLRTIVDEAFRRAGVAPRVVAEIDGLPLLMDAVRAGLGATIQPGSVAARAPDGSLSMVRVTDALARRTSVLASLSDDELSPAALAARVVVADVVRGLVAAGRWRGATLHDS